MSPSSAACPACHHCVHAQGCSSTLLPVGTQLKRMPLVMKQNEATNSVCIGLFRANAVMLEPDFVANLIQ